MLGHLVRVRVSDTVIISKGSSNFPARPVPFLETCQGTCCLLGVGVFSDDHAVQYVVGYVEIRIHFKSFNGTSHF